MKIKIRDSKILLDSITELKKKIMDAEPDLTKPGVASIANALIEKKEKINEAASFPELRDIMKEVVKQFDTPKSREIMMKIDEFDRLYQRAPQNQHNAYWCWERLLKYCYNILLKASGNPSPDIIEEVKAEDSVDKENLEAQLDAIETQLIQYEAWEATGLSIQEQKHKAELEKKVEKIKSQLASLEPVKDACVKDEEDEVLHLAKLLGEAHDKIMEAHDLVESLEQEGIVSSNLTYAIEDLESDASELDFMGESDPKGALLEQYADEESEAWEIDEEDW